MSSSYLIEIVKKSSALEILEDSNIYIDSETFKGDSTILDVSIGI